MTLPLLKLGQVKQIPLAHIHPDEHQIRQTFDDAYLEDLANDIALRGIEQPIVVCKNGAEGYQVKHGECRRRAAVLAGLETAPVMLAQKDTGKDAPLNRLFDQYAENMRRQNLNPMDLAFFYKRLRDEFGYKVSDIPALLETKGLKKLNAKTISNAIRTTTLPDWAQDYIQQGKLSPAHGKYLFVCMKAPAVANAIEKELKKELSAANPDITVQHLRHVIWQLFNQHYIDIRRNEWELLYRPDEATFYLYEELSAEEKKALNIVQIPTAQDGDTRPFAINITEHKRINKQYRAQWEKEKKARKNTGAAEPDPAGPDETERPAARRPDIDNPPQNEAAPDTPQTLRTGPSEERLRFYLHAWLRDWIADKLPTLTAEKLDYLRNQYCLWLAFNCPCYIDPTDIDEDIVFMQRDNPIRGQSKAAARLRLNNLHAFLPLQNKQDQSMLYKSLLLDETLPCLNLGNTCILAHHLNININEDYVMNIGYAEMYTKAGLYDLLFDSPGTDFDQGEIKKMKIGELREHVVRRYKGTPSDIKALYEFTLGEAMATDLEE